MAHSVIESFAGIEGAFLRCPQGTWYVSQGPIMRSDQAHPDCPSFYAPDFFLREPRPWWIPENLLITQEPEMPSANGSWSLDWQDPDIARFEEQFEEFTRLNHEGLLEKVVPVVFATAKGSCDAPSRAHLLATMGQAPLGLWAYGVWSGEEAMFGITPELLFDYSEGVLQTMALAGTAARDAERSLLDDPKERREHELVAQDIRQKLAGLGGELVVGETQEREFVSLKHLLTPIQLKGIHVFDFMQTVKRLHPTPALGGLPRAEALAFLEQWGQDRGRFGAPFGLNQPGQRALSVVAIRNLQWQQGQWRLGAGCGVIAASQFEREWRELGLKRGFVRRVLGLA